MQTGNDTLSKAGPPRETLDEQKRARIASGPFAFVRLASSELTRDINRDLVLERISALQPTSRVDLARASGLQPSTISSIVEQLLGEGWITESAMIKTARGRRPTLLSLNDDFVILTADIRPNQAVVALVDLNGRLLARQLVPLAADAERSISLIAAAMDTFRKQYPHKTHGGVGISVPGRVDPVTRQLLMAPNLPWGNFDIQAALSRRLKLRVELENAANVCLLSELWFGRVDGTRNAVLVTVSEGVGTAILAEGQLIFGQRGMAGEFGHICVDPAGPRCACGAKGCWETVASSRAALRYYAEFVPHADNKSIVELIGLAMDGDPSAVQALRKQAEAIGRGLNIVNAMLSPELILFAGDITMGWEMSREIIERECKAGLMADDGDGPRLLSIGDGETARLRGAAAVVLQRHSGYYRAPHNRIADRTPQ
jgi:predicted NBD/HSP70 family sugar kinase